MNRPFYLGVNIWCEKGESNPHALRALDPKSSASASSAILAKVNKMVGHDGLEPSTTRLKGGCSTAELMARMRSGVWDL